jgi:hypothetical protein
MLQIANHRGRQEVLNPIQDVSLRTSERLAEAHRRNLITETYQSAKM